MPCFYHLALTFLPGVSSGDLGAYTWTGDRVRLPERGTTMADVVEPTKAEVDSLAEDFWLRHCRASGVDMDDLPEKMPEVWREIALVAIAHVPQMLVDREVIAEAERIVKGRPPFDDAELGRAINCWNLHRSKRSKWHGSRCAKCVRTSQRVVDALADCVEKQAHTT